MTTPRKHAEAAIKHGEALAAANQQAIEKAKGNSNAN